MPLAPDYSAEVTEGAILESPLSGSAAPRRSLYRAGAGLSLDAPAAVVFSGDTRPS